MNLLDKKQYQAVLINAIGDKGRFEFLVNHNTFKNYVGEPVGNVVKLKATIDVLETFLSVIERDDEEVIEEVQEELTELLTHYRSELEKRAIVKSIIKAIIKNTKENNYVW